MATAKATKAAKGKQLLALVAVALLVAGVAPQQLEAARHLPGVDVDLKPLTVDATTTHPQPSLLATALEGLPSLAALSSSTSTNRRFRLLEPPAVGAWGEDLASGGLHSLSALISLEGNAFRQESRIADYFVQPDPLGYVDSHNLFQGLGYSGYNYLDPYGLEVNPQMPEWHHLLPNTQEVKELLAGTGIDRNSKEFGVLIEAAAHRMKAYGALYEGVDSIHSAGWNEAVRVKLQRLKRAGDLNPEGVQNALQELIDDERFNRFFSVSIPAEVSYGEWSEITHPDKWRKYYEALRARALTVIEGYLEEHGERAREVVEAAVRRAVKKRGKRWVAKRLAKASGVGLGVVLSSWSFSANASEMGVSGAGLNEILDNVPIVGYAKLAYELGSGESVVKTAEEYEALYQSIQAQTGALEYATGLQWTYDMAYHGFSTSECDSSLGLPMALGYDSSCHVIQSEELEEVFSLMY